MEQMTQDVVNGINPDFMHWELIRELNLLSADEDVLFRPFSTLSSGERTKVLLAAMFLKETSFLLIDEPTDHLDLEARRIVSRYLSSKKGFILVSHDRAFLDNCIDHILSINRTGIELMKGNFTTWWNEKEMRDRTEAEDNERLKKEIGRLKDAARRTSDWSDRVEKTKIGTRNSGSKPDKGYIGHKAAKMMKRSKSIEPRKNLAIEDKSRLFKDTERTCSLKISQLDFHSGRLVSLEDISIFLRRQDDPFRNRFRDKQRGQDRPPRQERLREIKPPQADMRGGHGVHRNTFGREPASGSPSSPRTPRVFQAASGTTASGRILMKPSSGPYSRSLASTGCSSKRISRTTRAGRRRRFLLQAVSVRKRTSTSGMSRSTSLTCSQGSR